MAANDKPTDQAKQAGPKDKPLEGATLDTAGEEVPQVGKDPHLPADVPVQAGTALDPALPPQRPAEPVFADDEKAR